MSWYETLMQSGTATTNQVVDNLFNKRTVASTLDAQKEMNDANNKSTETIAALLASQDKTSESSDNTVLIVVVVIVVIAAAFFVFKKMNVKPV